MNRAEGDQALGGLEGGGASLDGGREGDPLHHVGLQGVLLVVEGLQVFTF